jgi:hypothetical protein
VVLRDVMVADTLVASNINSAGMWICGQARLMSAVVTFIKRAYLEKFLEALYVVLYFSIGCYDWILSTLRLYSLKYFMPFFSPSRSVFE